MPVINALSLLREVTCTNLLPNQSWCVKPVGILSFGRAERHV